MATYGTDLNVFDAADSAGNWAELSGHTSGSSPAADTENYMQNSISVSQGTGQASAQNAGMQCDYGSTITWTSGWVFLAWQYYTAPTNIVSWANGGMRIGIGSSSGNMNYWNAMGDDFSGSPYACWQNTAIDPEETADDTDGTPTADTYRFFGSLPNVRAKISKGSPHACDVVRYGRGEIYATGTGGDFDGYATANDGATARWGLFQGVRGGYLWKGLFSYGQAATSLTFSDSNKSIFVDDTPRVAAGFNTMQILNASTSVTWNNITITGVNTSITGSAPASPGDFDFSIGTIDVNAGTFTDLGTWEFNSNSTIDDAVFRRCKSIISGGADFSNVLFDSANDTEAVVVANLNELDACTFIIDSTNGGHAVELTGAAGTYSWDCITSGYDTGSSGEDVEVTGASITGDEDIHVTATTGTIIINVGAAATTPSVSSAGASVDVVAGQKTFSFTLNPSITGYEWRIYSVTALGSLAGSVELDGEETATADNQSYQYSYVSDTPIAVQIIDDDYVESITYYTLGNADQDITINLRIDNND